MHPIGIFGRHRATVFVDPNSFLYWYKLDNISGVRYENSIVTLSTSWHYIAVTFDGSRIKVYVDGALEKDVNAPGTITKIDDSLFIGTTGSGLSPNSNWYYGLIDEVRIYNRALSAEEIKAIYEATK